MSESLPVEALGRLLQRLDRPGDFCASGRREVLTPSVTVDGRRMSFPIPEEQARDLVARAEPAPYGRGGETIVDPSVRRVWQVAAPRVALGARFEKDIAAITRDAAEGLGVEGVRAEL
jgi:hypothetical protein